MSTYSVTLYGGVRSHVRNVQHEKRSRGCRVQEFRGASSLETCWRGNHEGWMWTHGKLSCVYFCIWLYNVVCANLGKISPLRSKRLLCNVSWRQQGTVRQLAVFCFFFSITKYSGSQVCPERACVCVLSPS